MRIAYISTIQVPSNRANSIQVVKMCQAMTQLGHEVTLIVPTNEDNQQGQADWESLSQHYGLQVRFDIRYLPKGSGGIQRIFDYKALSLARSINTDLIYTRSTPPAVLGLLLHHSVILEMHEMPSGNFGPIWFRIFLRLQGNKRLVIITRALKQQLLKKYQVEINPSNFLVAPSGVDLERFVSLPAPQMARSQLGLQDLPTGVCTGHLYEGRGMTLFLQLASEFPHMQFVWVGGHEDEAERWQNQARENNLPSVIFTGFKPNVDIPLYQAAADFLMIPYSEGFSGSVGQDISTVSSPMKVFEYLASGRPIISSDLPVLHEVLNEMNAIFCPPGDVGAWKSAIIRLLSNQTLKNRLINHAKKDAHSYSWLDRCRKILANF